MALYKSDLKGMMDNGSKLADLILGNKYKLGQDAANKQADAEAASLQQAHEMAKLAESDRLGQAGIEANMQRGEDYNRRHGLTNTAVNFNEKGFSSNPESLPNGRIRLTPAQESAERAAGKQVADWDAAGGRPAMEKNLGALDEVEKDLATGKRDGWDRGVGALLSGSPGLMGVFGSTEKARRDKARNTALTIARSTDPNPTEKQIETIMGQIYDPASSDEDNLSRIQRFKLEQGQKASQMEKASANYRNSGYATIGIGTQQGAPPAAGGLDAQQKARLQELRLKHKGR